MTPHREQNLPETNQNPSNPDVAPSLTLKLPDLPAFDSQEPLFAAVLVLDFINCRATSPVLNGYGLKRPLPYFAFLIFLFSFVSLHPIKHEARTGNLLPGLFSCLMTT
jgi:hypothetical protein